ncbi:hypothetical protein RND71_002728 [Anisodus tanguticus]|uniref:Uncharacterized protein n=1 Tax=Anisodus tanguticus TaxID=243964 RepID=A0AAE1VPB5_9SOLA|nr:hypothetical protein RND71_002728 [Anisodus tanguticus]
MHKNSFLSEAIMEEITLRKERLRNLLRNLTMMHSERHRLVHQSRIHLFTMIGQLGRIQTVVVYIHLDKGRKFRGLQRDIEVLKAELLAFISEHGKEGFMPMRKQLRKHGRVDIEKAITRMGGFRRIASLMNLSLAYKHRKPKGYWDSLENL